MVGEGGPLVKDNLHWKTTFDGRRSLIEDDFPWKTTFDGRQILIEDDLHWKKNCYEMISGLRSAIYRRCGHFFLLPTIFFNLNYFAKYIFSTGIFHFSYQFSTNFLDAETYFELDFV